MIPKKPSSGSQPTHNGRAAVPHLPPVSTNANASAAQSARRYSDDQKATSSSINGASNAAATARGDRGPERIFSGDEAVDVYASYLTPYEQTEILKYDSVYYAGQNCQGKIPAPVARKVNEGYDDDRGDYTIIARDHLHYRYELLSLLGKGSFGQVAKGIDHKTGQQVAIKIIRNKKRFHTQAQVEIKVLTHLRDRDPEGKYGIIRLIETFTCRNHVCLTYELLSINLYEHMKLNKFHPMPLSIVKKIGASLLISLAFMWRENIIHCDLKPENILLRHPTRTAVKVIDLGSACFEDQRVYSYIQSRFYRAPEIILGIGYTRRIDLWSYACVLAELASGYPLFAGENEQEQLACMMEVLGVPPRYVIDGAPKRATFFSNLNQPILVPNSRKKVREPNTKSLSGFLGVEEDDPFVDFLMMFLQFDANERPSPEAAMRHPWICDAYVGITPKVPKKSKRGIAASALSGSERRESAQSGSSSPRVGEGSMNKGKRSSLPPEDADASNSVSIGSSNGNTNSTAGSNGVHLPSIGRGKK